MTDPAVEAVRRAGAANGDWPWDSTSEAMREAAREALAPIRDLHQPLELKQPVFNGDGTFIGQRVTAAVCSHCHNGPRESAHCDSCDRDCCEGTFGPVLASWPCATARLVYTSEELA